MFSMPARRILQLGDPVLREISAPASAAESAAIFADLRDTLHEFQRTHGFGRGISAVQIGELKRLIYIEIEGRAYALRNPTYEFQSQDKFAMWDDCFSFPDLLVWLERHQSVCIRYEDETGAAQTRGPPAPFPNFCNMRSTTWMASWPSIARWARTLCVRARNTTGAGWHREAKPRARPPLE